MGGWGGAFSLQSSSRATQAGSRAPSLLLWVQHPRSPAPRCLTNGPGSPFLVGTAMVAYLAEPWETHCMSAHETASRHSRGGCCAGVLHLQSQSWDCTAKHRASMLPALPSEEKCFHCVKEATAIPGYCFVYGFTSLSIHVSALPDRSVRKCLNLHVPSLLLLSIQHFSILQAPCSFYITVIKSFAQAISNEA